MVKHRTVDRDGLIVTRFSGIHTFQDATKALDELIVLSKDRREIYEIVLNDEDIKLDFKKEEEQLLIRKVQSTFSQFDKGALAVVANSDLIFGLSRMLEVSIQNERIAVAVFRSEALARKWIKEIRGLHDQALQENAL